MTETETGQRVQPNPYLSHRKSHDFADHKCEWISFYLERPVRGDFHLAVTLDGTAKRFPPDEWVKLNRRSHIP